MAEKTRKQILIEKRDAINTQIRQEDNREKSAKRKADTRRKILAGAAILSEAENRAEVKTYLYKLLDNFYPRPDDRALFGLPPRENAKPPAPVQQENAPVTPKKETEPA